MEKLNPQRLIALRKANGLTRQELATESNVSERQLARIELARSPVPVRNHTLACLCRALKIERKVLTDKEPLPEYAQDGPMLEIDPRTLRRLRSSAGLSLRELAKATGLSKRHLNRLESSRPSVRTTTINKIADALNIDCEVLKGDTREENPEPQDVQLGFKVTAQLRLAFDLVQYRYRISRRQLVELAPLLFTLLAEGSLAWRKDCLNEVEVAMNRLHELVLVRKFLTN